MPELGGDLQVDLGARAFLGESSRGHRSGPANDVQAAQVGPVDPHVLARSVVDRFDREVVEADRISDLPAYLHSRVG